MRCKNCGWPNKPQTKVCVKCHSTLDANEEPADNYAREVYADPDPALNKTMLETDVFGNRGNSYSRSLQPEGPEYDEREIPANEAQEKPCPKCGYPLRRNADKCPNCKQPVKTAYFDREVAWNTPEDADREEDNSRRRPTRMDNPGTSGKMRGTVNPYMMNMELEPTFVLQPVKRMNERTDFDEQEYEGKEVVLNRDNTEAGNPSITSRRQAVVSRIDGRWFIEDKSEQKTTFVQAAQKIELHDGDIILLGNRLFKFHE